LIHILVGDGLNTNEAAARILLSWVRRDSLEHRLRYFVLVVKCANHQTNLSLGSAVSGRAALCGAENTLAFAGGNFDARLQANRPDGPHRSVCGAIVRFFKFLVSDYYSDFCANLQDLIGKLSLAQQSLTRQQQHSHWMGMRHLYGEGFFSARLARVPEWRSERLVALTGFIGGSSARVGCISAYDSVFARLSSCFAGDSPQTDSGGGRAAHSDENVHLSASRRVASSFALSGVVW
jgi:hypothetical protein